MYKHKKKNIGDLSRIRTRDPSNQAAADTAVSGLFSIILRK
jgi:hypothetical protein